MFDRRPNDSGHIPYSYSNLERDLLANATEIPHHVLIVYGTWYCSGSLTASKIVVTAASCFIHYNGEAIAVKIGAESITATGQVISVVEYKTHEYFQHHSKVDNDIAIMVLKENVDFDDGDIEKVVLIQPDVALRVNTLLHVYGWGGPDKAVKYQNMPLCSDMLVLDKTECVSRYGQLMTSSNFCVRFNLQRKLSDNGGSAIYNRTLVGILSAGGNSNELPHFAILTNVSYFHRWIKLNTEMYLRKYCTVPRSNEYYHIESSEFPET
ncbi:unnamed protein product [Pieris macdunnoughi]|uniref:Peptidase S1 domain-containing protein n=1 Tax=Pieris macdunnoughi TaxID=345717 RepID=A0A821NCY8_9NEOP|nr:unnamed protein product [Pieris macdunnoughi]